MATTSSKEMTLKGPYVTQAQTEAQTKEDVDLMEKKQRLWDSLSYSYGKQLEQSDASYNKAISQQDRALLGRGMQRSSYGMQTLGSLQNQKVKAQNDIGYAKIADYENRLYQLERDDVADKQWERSFAENQRQFNENLGFQKSEAERAQKNWQAEYDEQRRQFEANMEYQRERAKVSDAQWQKEYDEKLREFNAQFEEQKRQYEQNFAYQQTSDAQSLYYNYVVAMAQNGTDPSDDLLAKAGLTRSDYNALKRQVTSGGGGSTRNTKNTTNNNKDTNNNTIMSDLSDYDIADYNRNASLGSFGSFLRDLNI